MASKTASSFKKKLGKKYASKWKEARTATGYKDCQSPTGSYSGSLAIKLHEGKKGKLAGVPIITMTCVVAEPDKCEGQSNKKDYILSDKGIDKTLARLTRDLKDMFPAQTADIEGASLTELIDMLDDLSEGTHECDFEISKSEYEGKTYTNLDISNVALDVPEDDDDDDDEDEDSDSDDDDDDAEDSDDDDDESDDEEDDDEDDDEDEEDEYLPEKGDICMMGRSRVEVMTVNKRKETCTVKNVKSGNKKTNVAFEKLAPTDD